MQIANRVDNGSAGLARQGGALPVPPAGKGEGSGGSFRRVSGYFLGLWPVSAFCITGLAIFFMIIKNPPYFGVIMNVASKHLMIALRARLCAIHVKMETGEFISAGLNSKGLLGRIFGE